MTDVTVAPAGGSAPPAAPTNEVPVNPNPVDRPAPVGSQAPQAPTGEVTGSPHRPESRREAIQRAFDRASQPQQPARREPPKPAPKPVEAKVGHNQPPEETPKDKPIDLRKRPTSEPQVREPQPRDRGKFAPREQPAQQAGETNVVTPTPTAAQQAAAQQTMRQQSQQRPFADPPQRMSEAAKRDWANTPETVRGDFHRMQSEFAQGYQRYKADAEAFQPVRQFHEMATQHGTTLEKALTNYVSMEHKLRADPIAGLDLIVNNLGLKTQDGRPITLRDVAYHIATSSPEQLRATQLGNNQQATAHQIGALHQEVAGLKNALNEMHTRQQFTYTRSAIDHFATSHPRFDELGDLIEQELKLGFDLPTAYRRAELLRPTTQAAQTRSTSTSAQTRQPDRSISGAPDVTASNAASSKPRVASRTPRDAVANAMRRLNGI